MNRPRTTAMRPVLLLGLALTLHGWAATPAQAQYPYGPGFAVPGYGYGGYGYGYGYGGYGYGYGYGIPGYGVGYGYPGAGPGYGFTGGVGPGMAMPGYNPWLGGFPSPAGFGGVVGVPGYGPSGIGYANPLFGLGLSPLAVQNAAAERALVRGNMSAGRPQPPSAGTPARANGTTTRGFPPIPADR